MKLSDPKGVKLFYRNLGVDTVGLRMVQDYNYGGSEKREISVELLPKQKEELSQIIKSSNNQDLTLQSFVKTINCLEINNLITEHCYNAIDGHFTCVDAWGDVYLGNPEIGIVILKLVTLIIKNGQRFGKVISIIKLLD